MQGLIQLSGLSNLSEKRHNTKPYEKKRVQVTTETLRNWANKVPAKELEKNRTEHWV